MLLGREQNKSATPPSLAETWFDVLMSILETHLCSNHPAHH